MKIRKTLTALLFAACLLSAAACAGTDGPAEGDSGTAEEQSTGSGENTQDVSLNEGPLAEPLCLVRGSDTFYKLIRPDQTSDAVIGMYKQVMRTMKEGGCGIYSGETDWIRPGTDTFANKEMIIGYTNRPESEAVMRQIGFDGYAVQVVDNKIVVCAHTEAMLQKALDRLCTELLEFRTEDGKSAAYLKATVLETGSQKSVVDKAGGLEKYSIVYQTGTKKGKETAEEVQKAVKKVFGAELPLVSESWDKTGPEIIIGSVNRDICAKYADKVTWDKYVIAEDGGDIAVMGDSLYTTVYAADRFLSEFVNKNYTYSLSMEEGFLMEGNNYTFAEDPARAEGTDIRIMTYNILCELWDAAATIPGRDVADMAIFRTFLPDVIGLQEVSDKFYAALDVQFGDLYRFTDRQNGQGKTNFSTLAYNTQTVKPLEHGVQVYSQGNDPRLRLATWAYFEVIATGKRFVAVSTHWDLGKNASYQSVHSNEMAKLVNELEQKYGCAVLTTGDYNVTESSPYYANFVALTDLKEAKYTAKKIERASKSTHTMGTALSGAAGESIDHIFGSPKAEFLYFNILIDKIAIDSSDHCPCYADVKLQ